MLPYGRFLQGPPLSVFDPIGFVPGSVPFWWSMVKSHVEASGSFSLSFIHAILSFISAILFQRIVTKPPGGRQSANGFFVLNFPLGGDFSGVMRNLKTHGQLFVRPLS